MKLAFGFLLATTLFGAVWPDRIGSFHRTSVKPVDVTGADRPLWDEYGFDMAEEAAYQGPSGSFTALAYRFKDSTGAHAAGQWLRAQGGAYQTKGNYLYRIDGSQPDEGALQQFLNDLPKLEQSPLPAVSGYIPGANRVARSERYILGPVSLERFVPGVTPSVAAFHFGVEAQTARYREGNREAALAIFSYPPPHIARARMPDFSMISGAVAKRSGPLVAVVLSAGDKDFAERLLSQVKYQATISWNETPPPSVQEAGGMIVSIFVLAGVLILASAILGFFFGGFRVLARKLGYKVADEGMTTLHLGD
jgi:hypothetical protein